VGNTREGLVSYEKKNGSRPLLALFAGKAKHSCRQKGEKRTHRIEGKPKFISIRPCQRGCRRRRFKGGKLEAGSLHLKGSTFIVGLLQQRDYLPRSGAAWEGGGGGGGVGGEGKRRHLFNKKKTFYGNAGTSKPPGETTSLAERQSTGGVPPRPVARRSQFRQGWTMGQERLSREKKDNGRCTQKEVVEGKVQINDGNRDDNAMFGQDSLPVRQEAGEAELNRRSRQAYPHTVASRKGKTAQLTKPERKLGLERY